MDKKKQMKFNINNFLLAVTDILDVRDCEKNKVTKNHSLRIAYISLQIAEQLNFEPKEMFDLCAFSLFHHYINENNIKLLKIDDSSNKISDIVNFVHSLDEKYNFSNQKIENRFKIIEELTQNQDENDFKKILLQKSDTIDFWMDCQSSNMMLQYIYGSLYDFTSILTFEEVFDITSMFGSLETNIDTLIDICNKMIHYYNFDEKDRWTFLIAASLVNFGKLSIPEKILNKKDKLSNEEYEIVKSGIYHNKNALKSIYGFDDISKWATRHQEQLDGKGYPSSFGANNLSLKDRLMAVVNIYDSLLSKRAYREKFTHDEVENILSLKEKNYHLDKAIVQDIKLLLLNKRS